MPPKKLTLDKRGIAIKKRIQREEKRSQQQEKKQQQAREEVQEKSLTNTQGHNTA